MQTARAVALAAACALCTPALAVEGPTVAGPIGGNDIRSAVLPPPGLYGGVVLLHASTIDFLDRHGNTIPLFRDAQLHKQVAGPFLYYVPKLLGGSIGFGGMVPLGNQCGHLLVGQPSECERGIGDPYIELDWSRNFGTVRPSKYPGAYPILQGLSVLVGFGMVLPVGQYEDDDLLEQVLSPGTNIWDFAPTLGVTYTTPPILAEGTGVQRQGLSQQLSREPVDPLLHGQADQYRLRRDRKDRPLPGRGGGFLRLADRRRRTVRRSHST